MRQKEQWYHNKKKGPLPRVEPKTLNMYSQPEKKISSLLGPDPLLPGDTRNQAFTGDFSLSWPQTRNILLSNQIFTVDFAPF